MPLTTEHVPPLAQYVDEHDDEAKKEESVTLNQKTFQTALFQQLKHRL